MSHAVFFLQIYPDPELEQQILALPIRCIHSEEGCRWTGQMKQLQVRSSGFLPPRLSYLCCLIKLSPPPFPNASLSSLPPQGHFSTCAFNVIPCPNRCSVKLTRRDLPDHLQHDCPKRKVKCEFCGSEFTGEAYEVNPKPPLTPWCRSTAGARHERPNVLPCHFQPCVKDIIV